MNAINMADGLDGLAGALAACINFGAAASLAGHGAEFAAICITTGAAAGFLYFNARSPWRRQAAVFMGDTVTLLVRRALRGRNPFHADRRHLHHILLALGLSSGQTVAALVVLSFALGALALAAESAGVPQYAMFYAYLAGLAAYGCASEYACKKLAL